eukprot:TRINITY_DN24401_c0_g1_i1.p1 TRINITY_DN24401_c0_g1~~TRINITY_DN24401_c0_g1_i1.p1  ORF type:complete len:360 (+),score=94.99 TRINITY_DN24401_c0_g1_i1:51-1130(+)
MAMSSEPKMDNFSYCLIPCSSEKAVEEMVFKGKTDKELRDGVAAHFTKSTFTAGQQEEFTEKMGEQIKENAKKHSVGDNQADAGTTNKVTDDVLKQAMMSQTSAEIVPVIYPDSTNSYKGISLYIDSVGRFKELPLNERASKMAQRDIRGDAFVISSYDDPIQDDWARISCTKKQIEGYIATPPVKAADPTAKASSMGAAETKEVTLENMCKAKSLKETGNACFKKEDYESAEQKYDEGVTELQGRALPGKIDAAELTSLTTTLILNRAQARLKLNKLKEAELDCTAVITSEPTLLKAWYRRATARKAMHEYDLSLSDLKKALEIQPGDAAVTKLISQVEAEKIKQEKSEKAVYKKMFA